MVYILYYCIICSQNTCTWDFWQHQTQNKVNLLYRVGMDVQGRVSQETAPQEDIPSLRVHAKIAGRSRESIHPVHKRSLDFK